MDKALSCTRASRCEATCCASWLCSTCNRRICSEHSTCALDTLFVAPESSCCNSSMHCRCSTCKSYWNTDELYCSIIRSSSAFLWWYSKSSAVACFLSVSFCCWAACCNMRIWSLCSLLRSIACRFTCSSTCRPNWTFCCSAAWCRYCERCFSCSVKTPLSSSSCSSKPSEHFSSCLRMKSGSATPSETLGGSGGLCGGGDAPAGAAAPLAAATAAGVSAGATWGIRVPTVVMGGTIFTELL
mmetsp:Transcript_11249/g.30102  ORF Transcript_11249/g.30102 Transcript_11249/m.30102 type:complete len:242 (+) Transcript_11249:367-1092(+)